MSGGDKLYWIGNIAKAGIISEILKNNPGPARVEIFDYGCGDGGDWPQILSAHPHLVLRGYEPYGPAAAAARKRLQGLNATILSEVEFATFSDGADIIVSFSVFEHVIRRAEFLAHARRILRRDGVFYLNYDDGHFRYVLNLGEPASWLPAFKSAMLTWLSGPLARLGRPQHYQRRVMARDADRVVQEAGFAIERCDYNNLSALKELAKTIPASNAQAFSAAWLDFERILNAGFAASSSEPRFGDDINLWRVMASRTLVLRHANATSARS